MSLTAPSEMYSCPLKAKDIPKSVSFDNLLALAKSRSNNNLHKLGKS